MASVKLYANPGCPYAHRTWIAAIEKGIHYEYKLIPLASELKRLENVQKEPHVYAEEYPNFQIWAKEKKSSKEMIELKEWYKKNINPSGEVPTVDVNGKIVPESEICSEFLDTSFPDKGIRLVPTDPYKAAKVRLAMKNFSNFLPSFYILLSNQEPEKDAEFGEKLHTSLAQFFGHFAPIEEGPFFLGKEFSLADIHAIPFIDRYRFSLNHYRGFKLIPDSSDPWVTRARAWWAAVQERQSFKDTTQPEKNVILAYEAYANKLIWKDGKYAGRGVSNTFNK